jgi:phage terminase Nu1 subunit (DNA packaging protein)
MVRSEKILVGKQAIMDYLGVSRHALETLQKNGLPVKIEGSDITICF